MQAHPYFGIYVLEGRVFFIHLKVDLGGGDGQSSSSHHHWRHQLGWSAQDDWAFRQERQRLQDFTQWSFID